MTMQCSRQLWKTCEAAARTGGVKIGNKSRVVKVIKTPFETASSLPEAVRQTLGYEFLRSITATRRNWTRPLATRRASSF